MFVYVDGYADKAVCSFGVDYCLYQMFHNVVMLQSESFKGRQSLRHSGRWLVDAASA